MKKNEITASGTAWTGEGWIKQITLDAGTANANVTIYDNTAASGTVVESISALANDSKSAYYGGGIRVHTGVYASLTGTGSPKVYIGIE